MWLLTELTGATGPLTAKTGSEALSFPTISLRSNGDDRRFLFFEHYAWDERWFSQSTSWSQGNLH